MGRGSILKRAMQRKQGGRIVGRLGIPRIRYDTGCRAVIVDGCEWKEKLNGLQRQSRWSMRIGVNCFADQRHRPAKRAWLVVFRLSGEFRNRVSRTMASAACRFVCRRRVSAGRRQNAAGGRTGRANQQHGKRRQDCAS